MFAVDAESDGEAETLRAVEGAEDQLPVEEGGPFEDADVPDGFYKCLDIPIAEIKLYLLRAGVVEKSRQWPWSSLAVRYGAAKPVALSKGPVELPGDWKRLVDKMSQEAVEEVQVCVDRGRPYGQAKWVEKMARELDYRPHRRHRVVCA